MKSFYNKYFKPQRLRESTSGKRDINLEYLSDQGRIIPSPAFRRLQSKAQVFSLEENAAVRTRLTHSLEVSTYGKIIAERVFQDLAKKGKINNHLHIPFISTVESACLLHDIGNPPFGHFTEFAIREWFKLNKSKLLKIHGKKIDKYLSDFLTFDGNAQGFRIITKLSWIDDKYALNLTCALLAAYIKYPEVVPIKGVKLGAFRTEEKQLNEVWKNLNLPRGKRSPINLMMEAADDIAYCLSDIEDGIEKGIVKLDDLDNHLKSLNCPSSGMLNKLDVSKSLIDKSSFIKFKIAVVRRLIDCATKVYVDKHDSIIKFTFEGGLIAEGTEEKKILDNLKKFAHKNLFLSKEAVDLELCSLSAVNGFLKAFEPLIFMKELEFKKLITEDFKKSEFQIEKRLLALVPERHLVIYRNASTEIPEVIHRLHLILDFLTGMTDQYAMDVSQMLCGISAKVRI